MRCACGSVGVVVGVVDWEMSVGVGVQLEMSCCVGGADANFLGGSSVIISIGVGWVSGYESRGR